jgi:hypothetical protein
MTGLLEDCYANAVIGLYGYHHLHSPPCNDALHLQSPISPFVQGGFADSSAFIQGFQHLSHVDVTQRQPLSEVRLIEPDTPTPSHLADASE